MNTITFCNNEFKIREVELPDWGKVLISTTSLNELILGESYNYTSDEARIIDEEIFYFVNDTEIEYKDEDLVKLLTLEVK
jgi:hypothetical protein